MLHKVAFWITCLLLVSTGAMAAPRASLRDGSQIDFISKQMNVPAANAYRIFDAAEPQKIAASSRLGFDAPSSGNEESDVTGTYRFEAAGKPRNRSRDILVSLTSQDHAATIGFTTGTAGVAMTSGLRAGANPVSRPVPANIRLVLPQPAAPPVIRNQCQALRLA